MKSFSDRNLPCALTWGKLCALIASFTVAACFSLAADAQTGPASAATVAIASTQLTSSEEASMLPDAPDASAAESAATLSSGAAAAQNEAMPTRSGASTLPEASTTQKYIEPNQPAPTLNPGDKILLGLRDAVSPFSAVGWIASAGYAQLVNGSPNYGTDRGAFGQRLGATAIRDISEGIITDSVMSPILHEDPRYYRMGRTHGFVPRAIYAATRTIITRTDGGRLSPNFALIAGNLGGAALTNLYYPRINRGPVQTLETFGGSMGGSVLGDLVTEFYTDVVRRLHHSQP